MSCTMGTAPDGIGMFIWEPSHCEGGNWDAIIAKAHASGLKWLALHNFYSKSVIEKLKAAGFYVAYSFYCTPHGGDGPIQGAGAAASYGADAILFDAETAWEVGPNGQPMWHGPEATTFIKRLRQVVGDTYLANAGAWQRPQFHPKYPDKEFAAVCDAAMPEVYWTEYPPSTPYAKAIQDSEDSWKKYPDVQGYKSIIRLGSCYGTNGPIPGGHQPINVADIENFITRYPTCAFWSWMHMPHAGWDMLKARVTPPVASTPVV